MENRKPLKQKDCPIGEPRKDSNYNRKIVKVIDIFLEKGTKRGCPSCDEEDFNWGTFILECGHEAGIEVDFVLHDIGDIIYCSRCEDNN